MITVAVCTKCGTLKYGAFYPCPECEARPTTDREFVESLACSEHYLDMDNLREVGEIIRTTGEPPEMNPEAYDVISRLVVEAKTSLIMNERFEKHEQRT